MRPFLYPSVLELRVLETRLPRPLGQLAPSAGSPARLLDRASAPQPMWRAVRALLARFGRRPSHQLQPGAERLWRAAVRGHLHAIDRVVDAAAEAALLGGLPIATADADRLRGQPRIAELPRRVRIEIGPRGATADVGGLPAIVDDLGPCITPVAVAQRVHTTGETRRTLSIVWGPAEHASALEAALADLRRRLAALGDCAELELPAPIHDPVGRALLDEILAYPERDDARAVFADWLDTRGGLAAQRRAALIRRGSAAHTDYALQLEVAEDVGLARAPLGWERGFATHLNLTGDPTDIDLVDRLRDEPITQVTATRGCGATRLPATTRELSLWSPAIHALVHPAPHRLRRLQLSGTPDAAGWSWIASLPALESLMMHIADDAAWQLATTTQWPALGMLKLQGGRLSRTAAASLPLAQLTSFSLTWCHVDDAAFARLSPAPSLRSLTLSKQPLTTLAPLDRSPLRYLSLWDLPLHRAEADRIAAIATLETLHISDCPAITPPLIAAIERGALPALRETYGFHVGRPLAGGTG